MIVVDIEASGVDNKKHSILSIGAVDLTDPENTFYEECKIWEGAHIMKEALVVNGFSEEQVTDEKKQTPEELIEKFLYWAKQSNSKTLAGHNTHFDVGFLQDTAHRAKLQWPFAFRIIDLHSICYAHLVRRGQKPPVKKGKSAITSTYVLKYVGLEEEPKPHNGLNGAKYEAEALNRFLHKKGLLKEFEKFSIPEYL